MSQLLRFLVPLLLVQGTSVHAVEFPAFTWDKVPIYQMFADNEHLLTDAEVAEIGFHLH
jgi:hypothetical protein